MTSSLDKPQTFNGDLYKLPSALNELKSTPNWVLWKWQKDKKGNWKKPPFQPNGSMAKTNEPNTWSSYADVMDAYASGKFDGIGFNLSGSSFGAYDLDKCRDPDTEVIDDDAKELMEQIGSYREISPSGTGIRIIGTAIGGDINTKHGRVEIYRNTGRYITITGNALNGATSLNNIDASIDALSSSLNQSTTKSKFIHTENLMEKQFDSIKWILPNFITERCSLLVGRPKIGKSWLVLQVAMAVSCGGITLDSQCEAGDVLYCALEDNERRLQDRLRRLLNAGAKMDASRLTFLTEMPRIDKGAIGTLKDWVTQVKAPRLIIIDCLANVRSPAATKQSAYDNDYAALAEFRNFANKYNIADVVVHHGRKFNADDPFDTVSGTLGLN